MAKIMFIHHSGLIGGAGVSFINVLETLVSLHDVYVFVPSDPMDILDRVKKLSEKNRNLKVFSYGRRIGALTYYSGGDALFSPRFIYRFLLILCQYNYWNKRIKEINPDVVITNSKILSWMSMLSEWKTRQSICFVRETMKGNKSSFPNRVITYLLNTHCKVVFLSDYDKKKEGLTKARSYVIHDFISDNQFSLSLSRKQALKSLGLSSDYFYALYVGGVSEMKGFDLIIQSIVKSSSDIHLIVAGNDFDYALSSRNNHDVKYAKKWERFLNENDKNNQIHFVGRLQDMSMCYAACDVMTFPMRDPHQARPVFEAGLYRKPIIITDFENINEFVQNGYNGFTVPKNDYSAIIDKLEILKSDINLRERMGRNNYTNTLRNHMMNDNCKLVQKLIEE